MLLALFQSGGARHVLAGPHVRAGNASAPHVLAARLSPRAVTEILVVQLLGSKEWLHCREKTNVAPFLAVTKKLDKCTTYDAEEMAALECERVTTAPGDVLFLPPGWWHHIETRSDLSFSIGCRYV